MIQFPYSFSTQIHAVSCLHIHLIQATILLAYYLYDVGRTIEGQYHANSAVTLALSASLHRLPMSSVNPEYPKGLVSLSVPFDAACQEAMKGFRSSAETSVSTSKAKASNLS